MIRYNTPYYLQDLGCTFPECKCKVPDYAYSDHNRRVYCTVFNNRDCDCGAEDKHKPGDH